MKKQQGKVKDVEKIWLSSREVKAYMDISDDILQVLRNTASISFSKVPGGYLHDKRSIDRYIESNKIV